MVNEGYEHEELEIEVRVSIGFPTAERTFAIKVGSEDWEFMDEREKAEFIHDEVMQMGVVDIGYTVKGGAE